MSKFQKVFAVFFFASIALFCDSSSWLSGAESQLIANREVAPLGLIRPWFSQLDIAAPRSTVTSAILENDTLFLISSDARIHVVNAETGLVLWTRSLGNAEKEYYLEPAVNSRMVAVVSNMSLYVFNRWNGKLLFQTGLPGVCSAPCALSEQYAYIPIVGGRIIAFPLEEEEAKSGGDSDAATSKEPVGSDSVGGSSKSADDLDDPVFAEIVKSFEATKRSIYPTPPVVEPKKEVTLKGPISLPMQNLTVGSVLLKPNVSSQILTYSADGRISLPHREFITWTTDKGTFVAAGIDALSQTKLELRYAVDASAQTYFMSENRIVEKDWGAGKDIVVQPTTNQSLPLFYGDNRGQQVLIPSLVVVGTKGGYVFAVKDRVGEVAWQFAAKGPVMERIAVVGSDVYCPVHDEGMHAIDIVTGKEKWFAPGFTSFITATRNRLYGLSKSSHLLILNRETGQLLHSFDARKYDRFLFNLENDRIFVISDSGLMQMLRERVDADADLPPADAKPPKPLRHRLTCEQYVEIIKGNPAPQLYWMSAFADWLPELEATPASSKAEKGESNPFAQ